MQLTKEVTILKLAMYNIYYVKEEKKEMSIIEYIIIFIVMGVSTRGTYTWWSNAEVQQGKYTAYK